MSDPHPPAPPATVDVPHIGADDADELEAMVDALPQDLQTGLRALPGWTELVELVLDLGRAPEVRLSDGAERCLPWRVQARHLEAVVEAVGEFTADNRAGVPGTLHRFSAIRNRTGRVVGLTVRRGRALYGTTAIVADIVAAGPSVLLLGPPGVGKTTMLREMARVLANEHGTRVVVVDTSNEIGGDGDVPHPGIGRARRMQVAAPDRQHRVMIEAVENHMPQVIVVDEIGTELEAEAARTIAERGVRLIATAHGQTLDNVLLNPLLSDLVGGVESVTLGDDEARRRGTQKTVLERRSAPTFDTLIELHSRDAFVIHNNVAASVDAILSGRAMRAESRMRLADGRVLRETLAENRVSLDPKPPLPADADANASAGGSAEPQDNGRLHVLPFGVSRSRFEHAIANSASDEVRLVRHLSQADVVVTLRSFHRKRARVLRDAEARAVPVFVLRSNTLTQMEACLAALLDAERPPPDEPRPGAAAGGAPSGNGAPRQRLRTTLDPRPRRQ